MRFKKPKPLYRPAPAAAQPPQPEDAIRLALELIWISTEDKDKFIAFYRGYLDEYKPKGQTQRDLLEEMVLAKWRQRRCASIESGILNVTMDRMAKTVDKEFAAIPNPIRAALAYTDQHGQDGALARIARDEARHARAYHRALKLLRELQAEDRDRQGAEFLPNEPEPHLTPVISIDKNTGIRPDQSGGPSINTGG